MITAHLGNIELELPRSFTFEIIQQSQLFSWNELKGDCVPSISFANTRWNRSHLYHPDRFELQQDGNKEYKNFELRCEGLLLIRGTLVLTDMFNGYVRGNVGNLSQLQKDKLLFDNDLNTSVAIPIKTAYDPDVDDYAFPTIINSDFYRDVTKTRQFELTDGSLYEESMFQHYHRTNSYVINAKRADGSPDFTYDNLSLNYDLKGMGDYTQRINPITPMFFLFRLIKRLLQLNGHYLTYNQIENADLKRLVVYNNYSLIEHISTKGYIITERDKYDYSRDDITYEYWSIDLGTQNSVRINEKKLLPKINLRNLLLSTQNTLNCFFVFNADKTVQLLSREAIITGGADDLNEYLVGEWQLGKKRNTTIKFVMEHDTNDFYFSTYYQDLSERESDFGEDVTTYDDLKLIAEPFMGELRRVTSEQKIYEYNFLTSDDGQTETDVVGWQFISIDYQHYKYNSSLESDDEITDELEIKTQASTLVFSDIATAKQKGACNLRKDTEAYCTLRFLFDVDGIGKNNTLNYQLNWRYQNNLIERRWKRTVQWLAHLQPVTAYFDLPGNMLHSFNIHRKKATRHGQFVIERMVTQCSHNGIGLTKIEGYKR